ncbi:MAG: DEAD/DEAH box helicase [Proteobacteria bacterium]|nr:DEAD/DEAH box helicase [Pseudomonadota bacterium]MBU1743371.1 DEAD/DEAH box helicase [Pseudomonadota bacterium]
MTFHELSIDKRILKAITEMGFETPMPVQQKVIPFLLHETRDLVALAHTGTGKTAAFGIPIIQKVDPFSSKTQALILAPTRELCLQITDDLNHFAKHIHGLNIVPIYGGANILTQIRQISSGAQIIVATPGRMLDMLNRKKVNVSDINWLVLDEADEMLNMGFKEDLNAILSGTPDHKRVLLFSATMAREIEAIAQSYMKKPVSITVGSKNTGAENVNHQYYVVHARDRYSALKRIADYYPDIYSIVFCRTKIETQEIADSLIKDGYNADSLHGDLSQPQRDNVMNRFRSRNIQMLVATDVAARGIDVVDLTHIINYNLPDDIEHYTHRSGRTGRAGKSGISIVIIHLKEIYKIRQIEKQLGKKFTSVKIPTGNEICEKQLYHLVDKVKNTEIQHQEIAAFLPAVYDKLKEISKEDIIQRFVSAEFNRFLNYYKNAPDINVDLKKRESGTGVGVARLFVNIGLMERFTPKSLKTYLTETAKVANLRIVNVTVMKNCSSFETDTGQADPLIAAFQKVKFKNRRVQIEHAGRRDRKEKGTKRYPPSRDFTSPNKKGKRY